MIIHTRNTRYVLKDIGDGAFLIQGHEDFCPLPIKATLLAPPEKGKFMIYVPQEGDRQGHRIVTTDVQQVILD